MDRIEGIARKNVLIKLSQKNKHCMEPHRDMRNWKLSVFAFLLFCSVKAFSFDFPSSYYSVYEKPGTGNTTVVYIVPRSVFLLLTANQPSVSLKFIPKTTGYQTVLYADGSLGTFTKVNYTINDMAGVGATLSNYKLFDGDFNADNNKDFLLQGTGTRHSVALTTDVNGEAQIYYKFGTDLNRATYPTLVVIDADRDGRSDIQITNASNNLTTYYSNFAGYFDSTSPVTGDTTTTLVGSINGKFRVDESGNSTYSVDVLTAAGTAGVAPHISLNYSSGAGDGVMGEGWSIGGLSAITRCRQTLAQDNNTTAITLTATDRFCLDGQRLILTTGTYGASGSTYRTEIDSYAVITANGGTAGNPAYFTVIRKDGSTSYYGNGNGSQLALNGTGPVLTWALSRFQDSVGNPIRFSYLTDSAKNEQLISRIDFGYGSNTTATSNSTTYLSFNYEDRPDSSSGYVAGSKIQRTKRLRSIYSFNSGNEIRHYTPAYRTTNSTNYQSYVGQLFECVGSSCLSPTTFNWDLNSGGFQAGVQVVTVAGSTQLNLKTMDINGDNKSDLVYIQKVAPFNVYYRLWNGTAYSPAVQVGGGNGSEGVNLHVIDFNNDGYQDLLVGASNQTWKLYVGGVSGLTYWGDTGIGAPQIIDLSQSSWGIVTMASDNFVDINGDGIADFVKGEANGSLIYRMGTRSNISGQWVSAFGAQQAATTNIGPSSCTGGGVVGINSSLVDFNGDGNVDVPVTSLSGNWSGDIYVGFGFYVDCVNTSVLMGNGAGAFTGAPWVPIDLPNNFYESFIDINGDGLPDRLYGNGGNWYVQFNIGGQWGSSMLVGTQSDLPNLTFEDFNADGHSDLMYRSGSNVAFRLYNAATSSFGAATVTALPFQAASGSIADDQYISVDIDADGHADMLRVQNTSSNNVITLYKSADVGKINNKITSIDNGFGNTTNITYKPLTDTSVYTKANNANDAVKWPGAPVFDILAPSYVVASVSSTAPRANDTTPNAVNYGSTSSVSYRYSGLKMQAGGRGSLGFATIVTTDLQSSVQTITNYNQTYPFVGQPLSTRILSGAYQIVKDSFNTQASITKTGADGTKYYQVYTPTVTEQTNDPIGGVGWELSYVVTTTAQPDEWGNVLGTAAAPGITVTTYASDHATVVKKMSTYNEYGSTTYDKQFSRLSKTVVTHSRPSQNDITRTSLFSYYGSGDGNLQGLLKTEQVTTPDGSTSALKTTQYDQFGNKRCVSVGSDANIAANCTPTTANRYETVNYDSTGRYVVSKQSPFKTGTSWADVVTEQVITRNALGLPTQVNSLNGGVTNITYDALGRESSRSDNTGVSVTTTYVRCGVSGALCNVSGAQYNVTTTANTGAQSIQYFDALGRGIAKWQRAYDGRWSVSETEYDSVSRVKRQSIPHFQNDTVYWATNTYDAFRLLQQQTPASGGLTATTSMAYPTVAYTEMTNALGQTRREYRNAAGEQTKVRDYLGNDIIYTYDAAGQLIQTSIIGKQNGNTVTLNTYLEYDQLGRKIKMRDSSKGTWFYAYNAFGDLATQYKVTSTSNYSGTLAQALADTSATLEYTSMSYDKRGRTIIRYDNFHSMFGDYIHDGWLWTYDTASNGVGQLAQEQNVNGGSFNRTYAYDTLGRPSSTMHSDGNGSYVLTVEYDSFGRPYKNTDALSTGSGTINSYNAYGYVQSVLDFAGNTTLYSVQNMDAGGHVTSAIYGNGATTNWIYDQGSGLLTNQTTTSAMGVTLQRLDYSWDALGNQTSRWDRGFDKTVSGSAVYRNLQQSFCYDTLNRLLKSHQGTLSGSCSAITPDQQYDDFGNITSKNNIGTYTYNTASPHQLQSTGDGVSYTYDKVGNLISDTSGRTLSYTIFDKVSSVSKGSNQITYAYGPDRNYYKRVDTTSSGTSTTYIIGNVEKVVKSDGSYDMKRYLAGVALFSHHFNSAGTQTSVDKQFMYKDALDSVVLITDNAGTVKQQSAYNSWGERVNTSDWQTVLPSTTFLPVSQQFTTRSYTGQEAMDAVGLVNYGGRIYDPKIARFVQADPFVQDAQDLQAYNRYAYVRNNPLTLTDPSGYFSLKKFFHPDPRKHLSEHWKMVKPYVAAIVIAVVSVYCLPCAAALNAAWTMANGGSFKDALIAGASTFAFSAAGGIQQVGYRMLASGFVGGTVSVLQGGKFGNGFVSAGLAAGVGSIPGTSPGSSGTPWQQAGAYAIRAAAGGTISELTGGKFENGAMSAVASYAGSQIGTGLADDAYFKKSGPERFSADERQTILSKINKAMTGVAGKTYGDEGAAVDAINSTDLYSISSEYDIEIGVMMYSNPKGGVYVANAKTQFFNFTVDPLTSEWAKMNPVATWHTHPNTNGFSKEDRAYSRNTIQGNAYVRAPDGHTYKFDYKSGDESQFR